MRNKYTLILLLALACGLTTKRVSASIVLDDTKDGGEISNLRLGTTSGYQAANEFNTGAGSWTISSVTLFTIASGQPDISSGAFTLDILSDDNGFPGSVIGTLDAEPGPYATFESPSTPVALVDNSAYWLDVAPAVPGSVTACNFFYWADNTQYGHPFASSGGWSGGGLDFFDGTSWAALDQADRPAIFSIEASPAQVPEPGAMILISVLGVGCANRAARSSGR